MEKVKKKMLVELWKTYCSYFLVLFIFFSHKRFFGIIFYSNCICFIIKKCYCLNLSLNSYLKKLFSKKYFLNKNKKKNIKNLIKRFYYKTNKIWGKDWLNYKFCGKQLKVKWSISQTKGATKLSPVHDDHHITTPLEVPILQNNEWVNIIHHVTRKPTIPIIFKSKTEEILECETFGIRIDKPIDINKLFIKEFNIEYIQPGYNILKINNNIKFIKLYGKIYEKYMEAYECFKKVIGLCEEEEIYFLGSLNQVCIINIENVIINECYIELFANKIKLMNIGMGIKMLEYLKEKYIEECINAHEEVDMILVNKVIESIKLLEETQRLEENMPIIENINKD